jgi:serine protease AprX
MPRRALTLVVLIPVLFLSGSSAFASPPAPSAGLWQEKVDPWVSATGAQGQTEFLVFLADQADLSAAASLATKAERGEFVYRTLSQYAEQTQGPLRRRLAELGVEYQAFWVANMIWVRARADVVQMLAERPDVAHIYANPALQLDAPEMSPATGAQLAEPESIEWNIANINAPEVWAAGANGTGAVIGGQDTGYRWTHSALQSKYRGWDGAKANHDYNWHDAIHTAGSSCGADSPEPCDDYGHGTHTMGTMVGDDGGSNRIGMAPGAKWIGCRNMDRGNGTPATYSECYQWFIAPTKIDGTDADPSKAPDVINNSWGCPPSEGCTDQDALLTVVRNVTAAGIVTVHSAGNSGPSCSTVSTPAAIYPESFTVGATDLNDAIASYSSRGPVQMQDGSTLMKPNVSAPGSGVRSSYYTSDNSYTTMSGTSMAAPHVAGLVALMVGANPSLRGNVDGLRYMIEQSALHKTTTQACGEDSATAVPNNVFGWGRIDAYSAYRQAVAPCVAPAAVTELAIGTLDGTQVQLSWRAQAGAMRYNVWWDASPYFTPGGSCTGGNCARVTGTSFTQAVLGDSGGHSSYLVQPEAACGAIQATLSNRAGRFQFGLVKGTP